MSTHVRHSGEIRIDPPIPVDDLKGTGFHPEDERVYGELGYDVRMRVSQQPIPGSPGSYRTVAYGVEAAMDLFRGDKVMSDLQHLVNTWGQGRTFAGHINCAAIHGGDRWSYRVHNGVVERVEAGR